jgi:hypothetical protein
MSAPNSLAQWIYRHVPLIKSEVSLLIAFFALTLSNVSFLGGLGVHFFGLDITQMAYISFWTFDVCLLGMYTVPWLKLPALANYSNFQRFTMMIEIWVWVYVLIALTYEVPWVFGYQQIAYAEDKLWAFPWWSYIEGGDIRYLYVELHVLFSEVWACVNASISAVALYLWYKSDRKSTTAVYMLMFCAGMHIAPTVQYYSLEAFHHFPNVDISNPNNFWGKFIFSNCSWLIMPFVVFTWGTKALPRLYGAIKD